MENFERKNKGFKGGFRGGSGFRDSRPHTMHSAICSSCHKPCEVPFRPNGDKPVYCRDCFAGRSAMGGDRSQRKDLRSFASSTTANNSYNSNSNSNSQSNSGNGEMKKQLEAINTKLEKLISSVYVLSQIANKNQIQDQKVDDDIKVEVKKAVKKVSKKK